MYQIIDVADAVCQSYEYNVGMPGIYNDSALDAPYSLTIKTPRGDEQRISLYNEAVLEPLREDIVNAIAELKARP